RPSANVKTRLPWIPPGKTSYKWESQGPTHCLEIKPPEPEPELELRLSDLASEEEQHLRSRISQYEKKIESLMSEVSSLRTEVEHRRKEQVLGRKSEQQDDPQQVTAKPEEELAEESKELQEWRNTQLRESIGRKLLQKLREAEADAAAAAKQVSALDQQKELLLGKLEAFEVTNRALRHLLREQMESVGLSEQRKVLLKSLADMEAWNAVLVKKLQEKEKELHQLSTQLDSEKEKARRSADLSQNLDATRARLQGQLRRKEAKNNRLIVQIKQSLERAASQHLAEAEQVAQQLGRAKQEAEEEQEALKRASQVQKQRAERCEGTADQLSAQLLQREKQAAEALASADAWQRRHGEEAEKKGQLEVELNLLTRISDLTDQLQAIQDSGRLENQALLDRLQALTAQKAAAQLETKRLKAAVSAADEKLSRTEAELQQVRTSIKQCEVLLDNYKIQNTRAEAEQARAQVAQAERDAQAVRVELEREKEQIRRELQGRLSELEVLPEALRRCQLQLQEAQEEERSRERRNLELSGNLTELRLKVSKREKTIRTNQLSLEEKTRECSLLSRRLEEAVNDAHQQTRERAANKERSTQTTIMDLEAQLSRTAAELEQLGHNIEEAERRYQSRLQDLQDRLEQSDSTNRSLQNYVQFLKASYANVFSDGFLSGPRRSPSPV
uniref:Outer dense fiber protein 2 n=1 Tax=Xiphophorus maculatus TaxID=8083 RepID=M4A1Q8_XIPMA